MRRERLRAMFLGLGSVDYRIEPTKQASSGRAKAERVGIYRERKKAGDSEL